MMPRDEIRVGQSANNSMSFPCLKVSVRTVHVGFRSDQLEPDMRGLRRFCQLVYGRKAPLAPAAAKI